MNKILVAYYSWTGHTAKIAEALAQKLSADVEVIKDARPRVAGGWSYFMAAVQSLFRWRPAIAPSEINVSAYDLVILGCPVWAGQMAPPMRSYMAREHGRFRRIALFCTEGGAGGDKVLISMAVHAGQSPMAWLVVTKPDLEGDAWQARVDAFIADIKAWGTRPD